MHERTIFLEALEKATLAEQSAYMDEVCAGDLGLRQRVEALLKSHAEAGSFLGRPVPERLADKFRSAEGGGETEEQGAGDDVSPSLEFLTSSEKPGSLGRLGHYEVLEVIGRGSFGIVVRAFDEKLNRVVAIKVMAPQLATTSPPRKRFLREARAAAAIRHENVVTIHSVEAQPVPYLVMEYIDGQTLQQRVDETGPLELREVLRIGFQIACGLSAAHEQRLIHRDIKPGNIMLENQVQQRVKVTDFGLARTADDASLTQSEFITGTPMYMAPEQALNEAIDHRADLFSLGSVLYLIASGRPPFRAAGTLAVLKRVTEDTPRSIQEIIPEIPDWLCGVIAKLQAKDPDHRYQTACEVADVLSGYLAHLDDPSLAPPPPVHPSDKPRRLRRLARWSTAALVLLLLGGLGLAEATGVTKLAVTVIRVLTPDGTLVVTVDDPDVNVSIEGDGGIVITGAGPQEVRLRPGTYKVRASKDGKPVHAEELVTISRGGQRVVRVSREPDRKAVPAQEGTPDVQAFTLLGENGLLAGKFATLAEAVHGPSDGDTIEVRGNGPFVIDPIVVGTRKRKLTIRAAKGSRPVLSLSRSGAQTYEPMLLSHGALVLEGLEFQSYGHKVWTRGLDVPAIVAGDGPALFIANCRFRTDDSAGETDQVAVRSSVCVVRNCEFLGLTTAVLCALPQSRVLTVDNCLQLGHIALCIYDTDPNRDMAELHLWRNTFVTTDYQAVHFAVFPETDALLASRRLTPLRVDASRNVIDTRCLVCYDQEHRGPLTHPDQDRLFRRLFAWGDRHNLLWFRDSALAFKYQPILVDLAAWKQYWGEPDATIASAAPRYQGGDLAARIVVAPVTLTPEDFRLRPESAGYRAGEDGKDLGADIDIVGPGPAYERWQKTPAYQQWLKDTGQVRK